MYLVLILARDKQVFLPQKMGVFCKEMGPDCYLGYCTSIREVLEVKKKFTKKREKSSACKNCRIDTQAVGRNFQALLSFISFWSLF